MAAVCADAGPANAPSAAKRAIEASANVFVGNAIIILTVMGARLEQITNGASGSIRKSAAAHHVLTSSL
jgi:hypothetical protein